MDSANPSPVRVLIRPPSSPSPTTSSTSTIPSAPPPDPPPPPLQPRPSENVVVVGFIGRRPDDVSHIMNRILDLNAFGSGNLDKGFSVEKEEVKGWFESRRISYYQDEEKGILFLQFCSTGCPAMEGLPQTDCGFDSALEEREFGDLQGMLFMFAVCHVIIYIQEGSRFDTQVLKKFRVLQAAKHSLAPFVRSRTTPTSTSTSRPPSSRPSVSTTSSNNPSPGRGGGSSGRNTSSISLMSGLGSYASLFPGQCNPVTLFVFLDEFSDVLNPTSNVDESTDNSFNQSSSSSNLTRPSLPTKGSGSVVVLARPGSKSEGGFRKKLQSSLEAQIRFLIKKCRTLTGSETHSASRGGGVSSSAPLFSLDASRAVSLLDRSTNQKGESLEFATGLVEDVLNGKATSDSLLLESHSQNANKEDILSVKEFIYRQSDILRGRGGLITNTNSGSAAGVGMVAAAAAAAAASTSSGKTFTTPELPSLEIWLSSSQLILQGVLSAKRGCMDEIEITKRKPRQRNNVPPQIEGMSTKGADPLDIAVSWLESGKELNMKFSTLWCERTLPAAKEVYLKDLPALYPTSLHETHLEKTLNAFRSMVKGPAVQLFTKKLEDECTSIWRSGRQLCDAVSLTGKPCMHQRHDIETGGLLLGTAVKPHSSGFFFLHACACGRSRKLRADPFDFETANITSNCFPDCDKFLPAFQLPKISNAGPIQPLSWILIRVGGAKYYEPSKGLLQSGFHAKRKFLLKWIIFLEKHKIQNGSTVSSVQQGSLVRSSIDPDAELIANVEIKKAAFQLCQQDAQNAVEHERKPLENMKPDNKKISFGRGLPNFIMRKPFSEVVAGSATADSGFPPLQQMKQPSLDSENGIKQSSARDRSAEQVRETADFQGSQKLEEYSSALETLNGVDANSYTGSDPFLQIGSNLIPVNINGSESIKLNTSLKNVAVYVGFEHECPRGHRFILTPQHLNELGSSYSFPEDSHLAASMENLDHKVADPSKSVKNGGHGKGHRHSNGTAATASNKLRNFDKSKETLANGSQHLDALVQFSGLGREQNQTSIGLSTLPYSVKDLGETLQSVDLDDGGGAFSLLNRNLPIYMNCPHCKFSKNKKEPSNVKFAGSISQLQRIFLVTPPFPVILATCPVVQFEASCLPPSIPEREKQLQFSFGCRVILPPESFLTLRLPFVYGVQLEDKSLLPLNPFDHQPERTAWITKGTTLQIMSKGSNLDELLET